jgi:hypothetical protein
MDPNIVQPDSDENKAKQEQEEQMRRDLLATVLDTAARERCAFLQFMDITYNDYYFCSISHRTRQP